MVGPDSTWDVETSSFGFCDDLDFGVGIGNGFRLAFGGRAGVSEFESESEWEELLEEEEEGSGLAGVAMALAEGGGNESWTPLRCFGFTCKE